MILDKTDLKILKKLQENGRITNLQLSSEIGLSAAPTMERVRKLEKSGFIAGYHASLNTEKLGLNIKALVSISLNKKNEDSLNEFKEKIQKIPEIIECYQTTGQFDYLLKVIVKDIHTFEKTISQKLSKIEAIGQMQSSIVISTLKNSRFIPLDYD
jgi:Lrp/AsnC family leucine-responsive transcriptional regulator